MKSKLTKAERDAEAKFAKDIYKRRSEIGREFEKILNERNAQRAAGLPVTAGERPAALQTKVEDGNRQVAAGDDSAGCSGHRARGETFGGERAEVPDLYQDAVARRRWRRDRRERTQSTSSISTAASSGS